MIRKMKASLKSSKILFTLPNNVCNWLYIVICMIRSVAEQLLVGKAIELMWSNTQNKYAIVEVTFNFVFGNCISVLLNNCV